MKWYQNVEGVEGAVFKNPKRSNSKYWGEGKWNNFIAPLLPDERQTFVEIGCNAGLFLKLAMDAGFERVIGVDKSKGRIAQAKQFRESNGYSYMLLHQGAGVDFDPAKLPLADVTLIANVHYHLPVSVFSDLVDSLRSRTLYCLIVSARAARRRGNAHHYLETVRGYFGDWQEVGTVGDWTGKLEVDHDDPSPRRMMYGALFKGCLDSVNKEEMLGGGPLILNINHISDAWEDFFKKVISGDPFDFQDTDLYQIYALDNMIDWVVPRMTRAKEMAEDILKNGMRSPIYITKKGKMLDGQHRLALANALGWEHILCRRL
jgi:hypothetical protein